MEGFLHWGQDQEIAGCELLGAAGRSDHDAYDLFSVKTQNHFPQLHLALHSENAARRSRSGLSAFAAHTQAWQEHCAGTIRPESMDGSALDAEIGSAITGYSLKFQKYFISLQASALLFISSVHRDHADLRIWDRK